MSKWNYIYIEQVESKTGSIYSGDYFCYDRDTFDYLINDNDWVYQNDAIDEQDWILDNLDNMLESNDGTMVYIPTCKTATRIQNYFMEKDSEIP